MNECGIGQIVFSKKGRDQGKIFVVIDVKGEYVELVDGKLRKIEKPKRKKVKHIQITHTVLQDIEQKLNLGFKISNADIRKALEKYLEQSDKRQQLNEEGGFNIVQK